MANDDYEDDEDYSEQQEANYEITREIEKKKKDAALYDVEQIRMNSENILRVLQVQLTKILMDLSENQKEISMEINAYWLKELPLRNQVVSLLKNLSTLINIYTQQEEIYKNTFNEITQAIDYPDYEKIEESYHQQMDEMRQRVEIIKEEAENLKQELQEEFENAVEQKSQQARVELHKEYEQVMDQAEAEINRQSDLIKKLKDELRAVNPNSSFFLDPTNQDKIVDKSKGSSKSPSVYNSAQKPIFGKIEIHEPKSAAPETSEENGTAGRKELKDEVREEILRLAFEEEKDYLEVKELVSEKYSTSSFFKYLNELIEDNIIEREGKGKDTVLKLIEED